MLHGGILACPGSVLKIFLHGLEASWGPSFARMSQDTVSTVNETYPCKIGDGSRSRQNIDPERPAFLTSILDRFPILEAYEVVGT